MDDVLKIDEEKNCMHCVSLKVRMAHFKCLLDSALAVLCVSARTAVSCARWMDGWINISL